MFFRRVSHGFSCFFVPRENGRHAKNAIPSTRKPVFSRYALAPPQRGRRRNYSKTRIKTTSNYVYKMLIFLIFFVPQGPAAKMASKMISQSPSGSLPGTLWEPPGTPWEAQDDPKRRQERPKKAPGAAKSAPRAFKRAPGSPFGDPLGPRGRPEASREPFWSHFGWILERFSNHSSLPGAPLPGFPGTCF